MGVILEDATIAVRIGPLWAGQAPVFTGLATSFMARARKLSVSDSVEKTNVKGAGQARKKNRYHSGEGMLTLSGVVQETGYEFKQPATAPLTKHYVEVTTVPSSLMETPDIYIGVIMKWDGEGNMGEASIETIEVDLDPDFYVAP